MRGEGQAETSARVGVVGYSVARKANHLHSDLMVEEERWAIKVGVAVVVEYLQLVKHIVWKHAFLNIQRQRARHDDTYKKKEVKSNTVLFCQYHDNQTLPSQRTTHVET